MRPRWSLYDFDAHWPEFWAHWSSDEVQALLQPDMEAWQYCENPDREPGQTDSWQPGQPLWHLSRTDYWANKQHVATEAAMEERGVWRLAERTLRAQGLPTVLLQNDDTFFAILEAVGADFKPKPGTIDSLVLVMGKNFISWALFGVAERLFPDEEPLLVEDNLGNDMVLIPGRLLVFDLLDFYFTTRDGCSATDYDALFEGLSFDTV